METKPRTLKQIQKTITIARDSVGAINQTLKQLADGKLANEERKDNIYRNVGHLKGIVADQEIIDSGENIADLQAAIVNGEAKLAENIWPAPVVVEE